MEWTTFLVYALLLVGMPMFVGMFVGSFLFPQISKRLVKIPPIKQTHLPWLEILNGLIAGIAGAFLCRVSGVTPTLLVPLIMAAWISVYCMASHEHIPNWCSWLAGLVLGWFGPGKILLGT